MVTTASAPGKVILCGEHAVVYGQPAIALPLPDVRASARVEDAPAGTGIVLEAPDVGERWRLVANDPHPLGVLIRLTLGQCGITTTPGLRITLRSDIPIASGMGSGAALGAALVKALSRHLEVPLEAADVSRLVYESERFYHGTPSGIDNTVVSFEQAIWFVREQEEEGANGRPIIERVEIGRPLGVVVADTGVRAPTRVTVAGVRERWRREPARYMELFAQIGTLVGEVRVDLSNGNVGLIGATLNRNHELLRSLGVSAPELDRLVQAARSAGAAGAKLSGGGGGGIILAVTEAGSCDPVARAVLEAGATRVVQTVVS